MKELRALFVAICFLAETVSSIQAGDIPGDTITNTKGPTLQYKIKNDVLEAERKIDPKCTQARIINTERIGIPYKAGMLMRWDERWTVSRCGVNSFYLIHFDYRGMSGTYNIQHVEPGTGKTASASSR